MESEEYVVDTVYADNVTVRGDVVTVEYTEQTEYTNNELLYQINENIANGFSLVAGLIGILCGLICAKELLKVWLT